MSAPPAVGEDKDPGISINPIVKQLNDRIIATENQNKRLKDLLIYHLDLIQQQNELITEKDKLYQRLQQENDFIKSKLHQRHDFCLPPPSPPPLPVMLLPQKPPVASTASKIESIQIKKETCDSFNELLLPENNLDAVPLDGNVKSEEVNMNNFGNTITAADSNITAIDISSSLEEKSKYANMQFEHFKSVDSKRSFSKKETIKSEALYTVTSSGGNSVMPKITKNKKKIIIGAESLDSNSTNSSKVKTPESSKASEEYDYFGINKKNEAINTYVKSKNSLATCTITSVTSTASKRSMFGSLSDRFQLIDTTPTGEDPYQLGEADLREQSPIPKLMLQKTNQGRIKALDQPARRIYDPELPEYKSQKIQSTRVCLNINNADLKGGDKAEIIQEPYLDIIKTETEIDWRNNAPNVVASPDLSKSSEFPFLMGEVSFCDSVDNVASNVSLECNEVQDVLNSDSVFNLEDSSGVADLSTLQKAATDSLKKQTECAASLPLSCSSDNPIDSASLEPQKSNFPKTNKRCKKKKHYGTKLRKTSKATKGAKATARQRPKKKTAANSKKISVPAMTTKKEYHTYVGDPDLTWYYGLDTDIKTDDLDRCTDEKSTTVEVPKWREKIYTGIDSDEGTENLDDKTFEKRHQKYEAEERRQLRWHMRRIREQRRLEKLKQRQLDSWSTTVTTPQVYTVWPRPQNDIQFIEITDTLPVTAFGEPIPDLKEEEFSLPWVRTSDELKRSKRSRSKKTSKYPQ